MKWNKAIEKIEQAQKDGALSIMVCYHIKWDRYMRKFGDVESIITYDWHGEECKAINLNNDSLNEGTHIIDEVVPDYFFGKEA